MFRIYLALACALIFSCQRKTKTITDTGLVVENYRDSGKINTPDSLNLSVNHLSTDAMLDQIKKRPKITEAEIRNERENFDQYMYFQLNLSYKNREITDYLMFNKKAYHDMLNKLSFDLSDFVHIETSEQDTIPLFDQTYVRTYGLTGKNTVLLVFERDKLKKAKWYDVVFPSIDIEPVKIRFKNPK